MLNGLMMAGLHGALSATYTATGTGGSLGGSTVTFSGLSIGAVPPPGYRRYIVAGVSLPNGASGASQTLSSLTIGGNAAQYFNQVERDAVTINATSGVGIYGPLDSGTTADITVDVSSTSSVTTYLTIGVWRVLVPEKNLITPGTPDDSATDTDVTLAVSLDAAAGGVIFAAGAISNLNSTATLTNCTVDATGIASGNERYIFGRYEAASAVTGRTLTSNASDNTCTLVAASWS